MNETKQQQIKRLAKNQTKLVRNMTTIARTTLKKKRTTFIYPRIHAKALLM